ncbi:MAG TPA: 3-hydroxyacyl-CoA dehydrogenase, partial [Rhodospirillales bacterium]|nr:3-hydroxyacyl-CoA dehydrogenase [Rhodospirillales bacterium]
GVVHAKDTVNFIGNRIGCFWMLMGLHRADKALDQGVHMETIDALMSAPVGLPPTGLYGLVDLIGLDVMNFVGKNLALNLPKFDLGEGFTSFPKRVQKLFDRGQLGRKSGGGFYRVQRLEDGGKKKETFDLVAENWRPTKEITLKKEQRDLNGLLADHPLGWLAWDIMGNTLCYAASLVPQIADDIINIDRAMRWGFAWTHGPFQMLDRLGPTKVVEKLQAMEAELPKMLQVLQDSGEKSFYRKDGTEYLGLDGDYHPVPEE